MGITFFEYHKPALPSGNYSITVTQSISVKNNPSFTSTPLKFYVCGERFSLDPTAVHAMFPPEGSLGEHSTVMPHIALKRPTFPWERSAYGKPWVALLLFDETEIKKGEVIQQTMALNEICTKRVKLPDGTEKAANFPEITLETGQKGTDKVTVIDVKKSLLEAIMPTGEELKLLTHVREGAADTSCLKTNQDEETGKTELAVVVGNRLPKANSGSTLYLVSIENRYKENAFDYQNAKDEDYIRLVSLKSWSFACPKDQGKTFKDMVDKLNTGTLRYPQFACDDHHKGCNGYICSQLARGYLPLPHYLRQGDFTYSWYHSPLTNQPVNPEFINADSLPEFGDALLRYLSDIGMFDVTYAAAYELGRVLAIEFPVFSSALYQWKHNFKTLSHERSQESKLPSDVLFSKCGLKRGLHGAQSSQNVIKNWLEELAKLQHIPFNYLVPDEQMLPSESIRFFKVDLHWLESLFLGALSIGPPFGENSELKKELLCELSDLIKSHLSEKSGFILRSALVSGYPDLLVDVNDKTPKEGDEPNEIPRMERLAPDVLFCLFNGDINTLDLYLKPEGIHFGVEKVDDAYKKQIVIESNKVQLDVPLKNTDKYIIQILKAAENLKEAINGKIETMNSALFAKYMLEKSSKGRFIIKE